MQLSQNTPLFKEEQWYRFIRTIRLTQELNEQHALFVQIPSRA